MRCWSINNFTRKKNRIILVQNETPYQKQVRTCLNGFYSRKKYTDNKEDLKTVTTNNPTEQEIEI
jgi:phosphoribosylaminoimidazolecarboxamide formyltransferase/IMP cyclohydrolase